MKRLFILALSIAVVVGLSACEEITNLSLIDVPITKDLNFSSTGNVAPSTNRDCADLSDSKDFNDNKSRVNSVEVQEAWVRINNLNSPQFSTPGTTVETAVLSGARFILTFDPEYGDTKEYVLGTAESVPLRQLLTSSTNLKGYKITIDNASIKPALNYLTRRPKFCIRSEYGPLVGGGTVTSPSMNGTFSLTFKFKVDPL
jgi:hypothetical protein